MSTIFGYSADDVTSEDNQGEKDAIIFNGSGTTVIRVKRKFNLFRSHIKTLSTSAV